MTTSNKTLTKLLADMKTFQAEYEALLISYKTVQEDYNYELKIATFSDGRDEWDFTTIPKKTMWGTALGISSLVPNLNSCLKSCVSNAECTGATYDSTVSKSSSFKNCSLFKGSASLNDTNDINKTAIIPNLTNYLLTLNNLNEKLFAKMNQLRDTSNLLAPYLIDSTSKLSSMESGFRDDYNKLLEQKKKISETLQNYNSIEAIRNEEYNFAHNENGRLRFWAIIALFIVLYLVKSFLGLDSLPINVVFFIIVFLVLGLSLNNPIGFATMGFLLLVFLLLALNSY